MNHNYLSVTDGMNSAMNLNEVEVDHLMGWSRMEWALNIAEVFMWPVMTAGVVFLVFLGYLFYESVLSPALERAPGFVEGAVVILGALALGFGLLVGGFWTIAKFSEQLFSVMRHCTSWWLSLGFLIVVLGVLAAVAMKIATELSLPASDWQKLLGISPWAVLGIGAFLWDGFHRVAASIPVAVGTLVLALVVGGGVLFSQANSRT